MTAAAGRLLGAVLLGAAVLAGAGEAARRVKRIVGGGPAPSPPPDEPAVASGGGAWVLGLRRRAGYYAFLGLRYAEAPVGRLRFQRPRRVYLEGEVDATKPGPPCPQPGPKHGSLIGSEDCLFLNVFTPRLPDDGGGWADEGKEERGAAKPPSKGLLPVLVWIHGGGFRRGSANQYGVATLLRQSVVVVTIQYRLGSLGFLSASTKELPGNAGLFDMTAAVAWVRRHVAVFGGDPGRVKLFGQGSGAAAALLLALSPLANGLFGGVLALSGSALSTFAIDPDPLGTTRDLAARAHCPLDPTLALVRCLQQAPVEVLVRADSALEELRLMTQGVLAGLTGLLGAAPVVEGPDDGRGPPNFLTHSPLDLLKLGAWPRIPLVTGVTSHETVGALRGDFKQEVLQGIAAVPGYVDNLLGGLIKCAAPLLGNMTGTLLPSLATNYFSLLSVHDSPVALDRLVEATGDSLFNLPAWTTAQWWAQRAPVFFYVFEHVSGGRGGPAFLHGLPLVQRDNATHAAPPDAGPAHGDDLPYAFDAQPLVPAEGTRPVVTASPEATAEEEEEEEAPAAEASEATEDIFGLSDPQDFAVQGHVTEFIAQFARSGVPSVRNASWPPFRAGGGGQHVRLGPTPRVQTDFRPCQMELWTGALARAGVPAALCRAPTAAAAALAGVGAGLSPVAAAAAERGGNLLAVPVIPVPPPPAPRPPKLPSNPISNILG